MIHGSTFPSSAMELDGAMVESVASFTDGIQVLLMLMPYDKSKIIQNLQLL
jgi:hypothetical protein